MALYAGRSTLVRRARIICMPCMIPLISAAGLCVFGHLVICIMHWCSEAYTDDILVTYMLHTGDLLITDKRPANKLGTTY